MPNPAPDPEPLNIQVTISEIDTGTSPQDVFPMGGNVEGKPFFKAMSRDLWKKRLTHLLRSFAIAEANAMIRALISIINQVHALHKCAPYVQF